MLPVRNNLPAEEIRRFGMITLGGFAVLGGLFWFKGSGWSWSDALSWHAGGWRLAALMLWSLGAGFATVCTASHRLGLKLYVAWMSMAVRMGAVMSTVLLSVMFVLLLPVFSLIRLGDPLRLKRGGSDTYWEDHRSEEPTLERMSRSF